ncbi:hypothetical protein C7S18_20835 [Ahniella affigens]|uniref:Uncharacterized protein n=1 Tax=Ahniella affigens TaxID=2021234 RepID=A0A2P1PXA1_9GAMM|nr:hypothetical protein [Ahniella affigens]AVP99465.1 hypothetical protein C7S18_20835 [Ahniella affigens]
MISLFDARADREIGAAPDYFSPIARIHRMNVSKAVAVAGFDESQFQILAAICRDLSTANASVSLHAWDGTRKDLIIINADNDVIAQSAKRLTERRGGRHLLLSRDAVHGQIDAVRRAMQQALLLPAALPAAAPTPSGMALDLPLIDLLKEAIASGANVVATCSSCQVLILPDAGKVRARNEVAFGMFRTFFGRDDWRVQAMSGPVDLEAYPSVHSLDAFLVDACLRLRFRLPMFSAGAFRLTTYPDLGELTGHSDMLTLASYAMQAQPSAKALADVAQVEPARANAFLIAVSMVGLIESTAEAPQPLAISDLPAGKTEKRSLWTRLARRFGLGRVSDEHDHV